MCGWIVVCAGILASGCDQAKVLGGPDKIAECKDYLSVLDACDKKQGGPVQGVEQRLFRKLWVNEVTQRPVGALKQECVEKAAAKRKSCGLEKS